MHALNICPLIIDMFANCYGYIGGHVDAKAAADSDHLFHVVAEELRVQPRGPKTIVGDFNAELEDIPAPHALVQHEGWIDVGASAAIWGASSNEYTCISPNSRTPTRRDYILVNPEMLPFYRALPGRASRSLPSAQPAPAAVPQAARP